MKSVQCQCADDIYDVGAYDDDEDTHKFTVLIAAFCSNPCYFHSKVNDRGSKAAAIEYVV